ncbi:MAG: hypothetical protein PUA96_07360 [Bacteroidales bacterium]|nr:hypothetical protein [Bacteroidales bacterium]
MDKTVSFRILSTKYGCFVDKILPVLPPIALQSLSVVCLHAGFGRACSPLPFLDTILAGHSPASLQAPDKTQPKMMSIAENGIPKYSQPMDSAAHYPIQLRELIVVKKSNTTAKN